MTSQVCPGSGLPVLVEAPGGPPPQPARPASDSVMLSRTGELLLQVLQVLGHDGLDEALEPELARLLAAAAGVDLPPPKLSARRSR